MTFVHSARVDGFVFDPKNPSVVNGITCIIGGNAVTMQAGKVILCCGPQIQPMVKRHFRTNLHITGMRGCSLDLYDVSGGPLITISDYISGGLSHQAMPLR